jgi:predicted nucleic acid-binding protein
MILADTSVWIDHFRKIDTQLQSLLRAEQILMHPFVASELALGSLRRRAQTLQFLDHLPHARVAEPGEIRYLIETRSLYALGIGLVDAHLLATALLTPSTQLWTRDRRLRKLAQSLGIDAQLP